MYVITICIYYCVSKSRPMKILLKKYSCFLIYQTSNMVEINLYALKFFFRSAKEAFGLKRNSKATGAGKRMEILIIFIFLPNANACGLWPFCTTGSSSKGFPAPP